MELCIVEGGLSGADIYTDGKLVYKTADNSHLANTWFSHVNGYLNIPRIDKVVGNTITMEYINHDKDYLNHNTYKALGLIQEALDKMSNMSRLKSNYTFNDYIKRIEMHVKLAGDIPEFNKTLEKLKELDLEPTFSHGDFGVKNMLFNEDKLYIIDPNLDTFGCIKLDVAQFISSLYTGQSPVKSEFDKYNHLAHLAMKTLCAFNKFKEDDMGTLIKSEIIKVYKYHPDNKFIISKVQQVDEDLNKINV